MISKGETFGLVYVEALSQGLPILYTKNQGIDGTFKNHIGEAAYPDSLDSIVEKLEKLLNDYEHYEIDKINFSQFNWEKIANSYFALYKDVLKITD